MNPSCCRCIHVCLYICISSAFVLSLFWELGCFARSSVLFIWVGIPRLVISFYSRSPGVEREVAILREGGGRKVSNLLSHTGPITFCFFQPPSSSSSRITFSSPASLSSSSSSSSSSRVGPCDQSRRSTKSLQPCMSSCCIF